MGALESTEQDPDRQKKTPAATRLVLIFTLTITLLSSFALLFTLQPGIAAQDTSGAGAGEDGCTWYFAEGCTRGGFEQWLTLFNPGPDDLKITVTYIVSEGANRERIYPVAARTRLNVYVNREIGSGHDLGMEIFSSGFFLAERSLYFNYDGRPSGELLSGGHISRGTREPSTEWYFAEGTTKEGHETWVSLLNPNDEECTVDLTFLCANNKGIVYPVRIPANKRFTVDANEVVGSNRDFYIQVRSSLPVVAERPVYFLYLGVWPGGHNVMGAAAPSFDWYFAQGYVHPGYDTWLCLANPGPDDTEVVVSLFAESGGAADSYLTLPGYSRVTAYLPDLAEGAGAGPGNYAIRVRAGSPIVAERPIYFCTDSGLAGGSCAAGSPVTGRHWYLTEGSTRAGFDTRLWLANYEDEPAAVTLILFGSGGNTQAIETIVPAASILYLDPGVILEGEEDVSCEVLSDRDILVERSTFFLYHDLWAGGDAVTACPAP